MRGYAPGNSPVLARHLHTRGYQPGRGATVEVRAILVAAGVVDKDAWAETEVRRVPGDGLEVFIPMDRIDSHGHRLRYRVRCVSVPSGWIAYVRYGHKSGMASIHPDGTWYVANDDGQLVRGVAPSVEFATPVAIKRMLRLVGMRVEGGVLRTHDQARA
jgi:hypothetical protein